MFNFDDPKNLGLLYAGLAMMQGAPGRKKDFAADVAHGGLLGLQAYAGQKQALTREQEEAQERELRGMRISQARGLLDKQSRIDALGPQYLLPAGPQPMSDDEGNAMPPVPTRFDAHGYAQALTGIDPMQGMQMQSTLAQMNARNYQKLGKGESLFDMSNPGRPIAQGAPDLPTGLQMGPNGPEPIPAYVQMQERIRAAGRPQTNVNLPPAQKAFEVELAKLDAKQLDDWRESAVKAQGGLSRLAEMKRLAQEGTYSGWGAEGRAGVANFFHTLGAPMDPSKLENSQQYLKHAKELTLTMLKEGVGASQISNADLAFVNETVPQLETSAKARMDLLNYMERRLSSSVERFEAADNYARERGGLKGFKFQGQEPPRPQNLRTNQTALYKAREAIKQGKPRDAVIRRMIEQGFNPDGL